MTNNRPELKLLTFEEVATILSVSKRTICRITQKGQLPAFKVGGQWRIRESQLRDWVEQREKPDRPKRPPGDHSGR